MKRNDRLLQKYFRQIGRLLPCAGKEKREIMQILKGNVEAFLEDIPTATITDVQKQFGTPQTIAASYLETEDRDVLLKKLRLRKTVKRIVLVLAAVVLIMWGSYIGWAAYEVWTSANGYIVDEISEISH